MSKKLTLNCSQAMCVLLSDILRQYANVAYPRGGSECSQSARESLLMMADEIISGWDAGSQSTQMSKRLRVMAKAAIQYYAESLTEEEGLPSDQRQAYLQSVFSGEAIDDVGYHAAQKQDRSA